MRHDPSTLGEARRRLPTEVQRPTIFFETELKAIDIMAAGIGGCDTACDEEFSAYVRAVSNFFPLRMTQKALAARLCVTPMTFQRWAAGQNLPYTIPRKAYFQEILALLAEVRERIIDERAGAGLSAEILDLSTRR